MNVTDVPMENVDHVSVSVTNQRKHRRGKPMNTTVISGRLVRNPGYNEVENEKGLHKIASFDLAVRRYYSDEV